MYTLLLECFIIAGLTVFIGTGLFLAVAMIVLLKVGVRVVVSKSVPLTSRVACDLREKLSPAPLAEAAGNGE